MSPQRRKGRGGGAGKVAALPPSSAAARAIDSSPASQPLKPSRQRTSKSLTGILPSSCKSSSSPSTLLSGKLKSKERPQGIAASSASSTDAFLAASSLCNAQAAPKAAKRVDCIGPPHVRSISKPRKCVNTVNHEKVSLGGSAISCERTRKASHDKEGTKASFKPSLSKQLSSRISNSHCSKSHSFKNSLQKEGASHDFRWSNTSVSLPSQINMRDTIENKSDLGDMPKKCLNVFSNRRSSFEGNTRADVPFYVLSPDRRYSMGSSKMSITNSLQSQCEEFLDVVQHVEIFDGKKANDSEYQYDGISPGQVAGQREASAHACFGRDFVNQTSDEFSVSLAKWQHERIAMSNCQSLDTGEFAECVGLSSATAVGVPCEGQDDKRNRNTYVEAADLRTNSSIALSRFNKEIGYVHPVDVACGTQQLTDNTPNHTITLHQRLALLEGRVSQIASELRKTKEMLDVNNPSGSVTALSDIQGKISCIEQARTVRTDHKFLTFHKNAPSEENKQSLIELNNGSSHQDSNPSFNVTVDELNKTAVLELSCQNSSSALLNSVSRKTERLKYDQQELEDRLFPHRKLLRSRISLHAGVTESRAALHSKLEDAVSLSSSSDVAHISNLQLSAVSHLSLRPMTGKDQCCSSILEVEGETKFKASHLHERMCTSKCEKSHHSEMCFVNDNPPTAIKKVISDLDLREPNGSAHCSNIGRPLDLKVLCPSGQVAPYVAEAGMQEADSTLQLLQCDESLQFNNSDTPLDFELDNELEAESEMHSGPLCPIGQRVATGGWYACDGEAIVLVHDDGCCSFYDVANMEEKAVYTCPEGYPVMSWTDCWMIRAPGSDGRANKYIVASASGSASDAGFCSWDFNSKGLAAFHMEDHFTYLDLDASPRCSPPKGSLQLQASRPLHALASYPETSISHCSGSSMARASARFSNTSVCNVSSQWWYRPCGPLMVSAGSSLKQVAVYDIRDGEKVITWKTRQPIQCLDFSSPVQWRNRGKLALAEEQAISIWDVNSLNAQALHNIELPGKRVCVLQMHNADAEYSGGVRQRLSCSDMEAYDGICGTQDDLNVLDFRVPNGIGICLSSPRQEMQSVFAQGDMVLVGGINMALNRCTVQQWSVRMGQLVCTYAFQPSSHHLHLSVQQVWGNSNTVMGVNGNGIHVFKGPTELTNGHCGLSEVEEVIGMPNLSNPLFDYSNLQILLISRDRPASWCYRAL
ncbi:hypothetical protein L7F22_063938 [Adiantum nelumboides]|nr:hypothetical protein [Adiantum nelumboides]